MRPALDYGDVMMVQGAINISEVKAAPDFGDVIVFRKPSEPTVLVTRLAIAKA